MFEEQRAPGRQVRAAQTARTVRVYQVCPPAVADAALERRATGPGGTWIGPSFRCAAHHRGNERVLAVDLTRAGFERALARGPVAWEPERDLDHTPLNFQAIRLGEAPDDGWITGITDVTPVVRDIAGLLAAGRLDEAVKLVPHEPPYDLPRDLAEAVGA